MLPPLPPLAKGRCPVRTLGGEVEKPSQSATLTALPEGEPRGIGCKVRHGKSLLPVLPHQWRPRSPPRHFRASARAPNKQREARFLILRPQARFLFSIFLFSKREIWPPEAGCLTPSDENPAAALPSQSASLTALPEGEPRGARRGRCLPPWQQKALPFIPAHKKPAESHQKPAAGFRTEARLALLALDRAKKIRFSKTHTPFWGKEVWRSAHFDAETGCILHRTGAFSGLHRFGSGQAARCAEELSGHSMARRRGNKLSKFF